MSNGIPRNSYDNYIKLRHLRVISAVEVHKGISAAAIALGISPSAISKTIGEIEEVIGIDLFEKLGRGVRMTDAGRLFVATAQSVTKEFSVLESQIRLMLTGELGSVTVGFQAVATEPLLAKATASYKYRHPRAQVRLIDGVLANLLVDLRAGRVDLVVGRLIPELMAQDLDGLSLLNDYYVPLTSDPELQKNVTDWKQALKLTWCLPPPGTPALEAFRGFLAKHRLPYPEDVVEVFSARFIPYLMRETSFCTVLSASAVEIWREQMQMLEMALPMKMQLEPIGLIWCKGARISPAAMAFRNVVEEIASEGVKIWRGGPGGAKPARSAGRGRTQKPR